ncbi:MAG: sugar phosphate isomerase/epimerase family protein, partial [Armatimonadota bacterium]|nr:sugar phosphate isomerase/epimerase family protein [Armatimonadota bacterium]
GKSAQSIAEIADFCRDLNIEVAVEVLSNLAVGSSASELLELLEMANCSNVGICLDVNHVFPPSQLIPFVHAVGKNLLTLHISDYDGEKEKHWLPGMGIIDWRALIRALNDVGYHGPFMYETRFEAVDLRDLASKLEENYNMLMASAGD